jgi:PD-(D/E)XK nuclease superfamily
VVSNVELHLVRHADAAWAHLVRPWLEAGRGVLRRSWVVVPTRGQAHALKQRCLIENVPLLGVEFLTPGLARKKWLVPGAAGGSPLLPCPALGRELLLLGLRVLIEKKLTPLTPADATWGFWKSLQSDPERALGDFDELLKAGFRAADFPLSLLKEIFGELAAWVESLGYALAPLQNEAAALAPATSVADQAGGRLLVYGPTAESWGEFFNVAALARRCREITVVLPEPEFRGSRALDERWVEVWSALLGVEARVLDAPEPSAGCGDVAALWTGERGPDVRARVIVGRTRADEMALVADEVARLLTAGADNIAVVFPRASAAHLRLSRLLVARGIVFADLLETAGAPPVDALLHRSLVNFYARGARLDELLEIWPQLHALSFTRCAPGAARNVCERVFDETQTPTLAANLPLLAAHDRTDGREVARVAARLLPPWPDELPLADALARFARTCEQLQLVPPAAWTGLAAFAQRETRPLPLRAVCAALASFLPASVPVADAPGRGRFAHVTLTTRRRAEGVAWSQVIFTESNAGVWPMRRDSGPWLTDEQRAELNGRSRFSLGLLAGDDRAALEKQSYAALARDTREEIIFTAALFDEEKPELKLAPNAWVERVLVAQGGAANEEAWTHRAVGVAQPAVKGPELDAWHAVWRGRRDPAQAFDQYFFSANPAPHRPASLAARLIERGVQDPAELWFAAVLGVTRVAWQPLVRSREKSMGQIAHRLLSEVLRGAPAEGIFSVLPSPAAAQAKLAAGLAGLRDRWPHDRYWDSFHGELAYKVTALLAQAFELDAGSFVAAEVSLPRGASVPIGDGVRLAVHGRIDLARLDRTEWAGAVVDIIDFKTGRDEPLSAQRMAKSGASLQLGIYLAAVESLGAAHGRVRMLKPEPGSASSLEMSELPLALGRLAQLGRHLATGCYGALTPDRTNFSRGFDWPLACTPIRRAVLEKKFAATFKVAATETDEEVPDG